MAGRGHGWCRGGPPLPHPRPEPNQPWDVARPGGGEHPGEECGRQRWEIKQKDTRTGATVGRAGHLSREKEIKSLVWRGTKLLIQPPVQLPQKQQLGAPLSLSQCPALSGLGAKVLGSGANKHPMLE